MIHDSPFRPPSGRMSPLALTLAVGLHVGVAAALWWTSPLKFLDQTHTAIVVTVVPEPEGAAPAAGGSPGAASASAPASPSDAPSETAPSPPQEPTQQALAADPAAIPQILMQTPEPLQSATIPTAIEAQTLWQTDTQAWKPLVTFEQSLPPPEATPPPPTSRDIARAATPRPTAARPPPPRPQSALPPRTGQPPSPQGSPSESQQAAGQPATPGSPVGLRSGLGGERNDYLSRVARQIERFREYPAIARQHGQQGRVVMRVTITRDGRLLDASVDRSSGWPVIDSAELATIRRSGKFPDVPDGMPGDPIVLILPVTYKFR